MAQAIKGTYGVKVGIRQLFEELDTVNRLATYIHQSLPPNCFSAHSGARTQSPMSSPPARYDTYSSLATPNGTEAGINPASSQPPLPPAPPADSERAPHLTSATVSNVADSALERMMSQQIQAMSQCWRVTVLEGYRVSGLLC